MPKLKLTNKMLEEIVHDSSTYGTEYTDETVKGLTFHTRNMKFYWSLRYSFNKTQTRIKLGNYPEMSLSQAKACALSHLGNIAQGINPQQSKLSSSNRTCLEVGQLWYEQLEKLNKSDSYLKDTQRHIKILSKSHIGNMPIEQVKTIDVERLLQTYWNKRYLHNRLRASLIAIFRFALKHEFIVKSPCIRLPKAHEDVNNNVFTPDEYKRIIKACESIASLSANCILLIAYTGCRPKEAYGAKWSGFNLVKRTWTKEATNTKQRKQQIIGISQNVIDLLQNMERNSPYLFPTESKHGHITHVRKTWQLVCSLANVKGNLYMLRKFMASELIRNGASIAELQRLMSWSDPSTPLKHYVKVSSEELADRMDNLMEALRRK